MWPHLVRRSARPEAVESLRSRFYSVPQPPVGDHQAAWLSSWSIALATNAPTTLRSIYWRQKKTFGYWHSHDRWKLAYMSVALTHAPQWVAAVTFVCLCSKTGITKAFFDGIWRPPVWCSDMWTFFTSHAELICASFNKNVHFISNTPFPQHEQWMTPSGDAPRNDRSVDTTSLHTCRTVIKPAEQMNWIFAGSMIRHGFLATYCVVVDQDSTVLFYQCAQRKLQTCLHALILTTHFVNCQLTDVLNKEQFLW